MSPTPKLTLCSVYLHGFTGAIYWCISSRSNFGPNAAVGITFVTFPLSLVVLVTLSLTLCLAIKWIMVGNYKKFQSKGLIAVDSWDLFRWMLSNGLIHLTSGFPLQLVDEFWLTAVFWRMMGAKIGKSTLIDPDVLFLEVDLLEIGDNCRIEQEATLLCHKFNNGGLEVDNVVIPSNTNIGARAVVLPGSKICDEHVTILPLTALNPGAKVTKGHWLGSPAEKVYTAEKVNSIAGTTDHTLLAMTDHADMV